jgi:hypothetical protein
MFETLAASLPQEWQGLFRLIILPIVWIPATQVFLLQAIWPYTSFVEMLLKRIFILLPALIFISALWATPIALILLLP